jgi:hypothetical protein
MLRKYRRRRTLAGKKNLEFTIATEVAAKRIDRSGFKKARAL